jgi:hypothetical protein
MKKFCADMGRFGAGVRRFVTRQKRVVWAQEKFMHAENRFVRGEKSFIHAEMRFVRGEENFMRAEIRLVRGEESFTHAEIRFAHDGEDLMHAEICFVRARERTSAGCPPRRVDARDDAVLTRSSNFDSSKGTRHESSGFSSFDCAATGFNWVFERLSAGNGEHQRK